MNMLSHTWITNYRRDRQKIVAANIGVREISVISLLPNAPDGVWSDVSNTLRSITSPAAFLSHLFCELVSSGYSAIGEAPVTLDGFLGSAHCDQDPWLLIPATSLWIPTLAEVGDVADDLFRIVALWEELLASHIELPLDRMQPATALGAFLPNARVPRKHIAAAFERVVRSRLSTRNGSERRT